jgi:hypothetical protein
VGRAGHEVDHGFGAVWVGLVVASEYAVVHEPSDAPPDGPLFRNFRGPLHTRRALDRVDVEAHAGAVADGGGAVVGVHSGLGHAWVAGADAGQPLLLQLFIPDSITPSRDGPADLFPQPPRGATSAP